MTTEACRGSTVLTLDVFAGEMGLRAARAVVRAHLEGRGVDRDRMDDSLLVAGELLGNALVHGRSAAGYAVLHMVCAADEVRITVTDFGPGMRMDDIGPVGSPREDSRIGGFGIPLVRTLCSHVEWKSSETGTCVEAVVNLDPARAVAPESLPLALLGLCPDDAAWLSAEGDPPGGEGE